MSCLPPLGHALALPRCGLGCRVSRPSSRLTSTHLCTRRDPRCPRAGCVRRGAVRLCLWLTSQPRRACVWECRCPGGYETRASRGRLRAAPFVDMLWGGEALQSGAPPGVAATGLMRQARHSGGCYSITSYHTGNHYNIYYYGALVITWISYVLSVPLSSPGYHMYCRGASVGRPRTLGPRTTYLPLRHYR